MSPGPGTRGSLGAARSALLAAAVAGCAPALREPPPVDRLAPGPSGASADELLRRAEDAWSRRGEPGQAEAAEELYLEAAASDPSGGGPESSPGVKGLLGAMQAEAFRVERERNSSAREKLAAKAVQLGQWCQRRAPESAACDYRLAIALGQQARERPSTAEDALGKMVALLRRAIAAEPGQDHGGPHRVLALVLLRAPGWPLGPGDLEAALGEARAAASMFPDAAENQLALGEALAKNEHPGEARTAYERALALAEAAAASGDPDAARWRAEALAGLDRYTRR